MAREHPNNQKRYKKIKYHTVYERGKTQIDTNLVVKEVIVILSDMQAKLMNDQYHNSGIKYELIGGLQEEEAPKKRGRKKKEVVEEVNEEQES